MLCKKLVWGYTIEITAKIIMNKLFFRTRGFLLVELIVTISVITLLLTLVLVPISTVRMKGRDFDRVAGLKEISGGLTLYYADNKKYPDPSPAGNTASNGFMYNSISGGTCTGALTSLYFDDATDADGLLNTLVANKYLSKQWVQPSTPADTKFLCRYVVPQSEVVAGNIQHYLLHCNLENDANNEASDGGLNSTVYEVYSPNTPQFCLSGPDGQ